MEIRAHQEVHFENRIVNELRKQGWLEGQPSGYDKERTLYKEDVLAWVEATQPEKIEKLRALNGDRTHEVLLNRLDDALATDGLMAVLRTGFAVAGCGQIVMSQAAPEDGRNQKVVDAYKANRLRVVRQLKYNATREWSLDLGFFINGLPVATGEIKTNFTQAIDDAIKQYKDNRNPKHKKTNQTEKLLDPFRGAVVHFAITEQEIWMTTELKGENTRFLPFNKGNRGRGGNPAVSNGYPVAYFWREVLKPDAWLRIFHSFVYTQEKTVQNARGAYETRRTRIFPRYHQWEAVNNMISDAQTHGPGMNYLCEHSAGSGKTATISWMAHDLIKLRQDSGHPIFNSVIIVTDRTVLDNQLQEAVKQIDHQFGVITDIRRERGGESKSQQLAAALKRQDPIIVVTIQTFPHAMEMIMSDTTLADKNFAVIIDEAHNSQTGASASKLQATLSLDTNERRDDMTVEELLELVQRSRKRPSNVSYFAFTATPKHSTFMLFGRPEDPTQPASDDNLPTAFHRYPMRQAIDEGYILDVLQNYTPYSVAVRLSESLKEDDPEVNKKQARRALAKWIALHPTNVTQKVEFIIEHFSKNVASELNGQAKAMVVTSSRAAAARYKKAFDRFIDQHPQYAEIKALVAFSGSLTGRQVNHSGDAQIANDPLSVPDDAELTEINMNEAVRGQDLRQAFDGPEYRVMLVANKFQTGFDQPKLVALYVDKKIANEVEIVQTFSRLNRTHPGKDTTYVVDFVNDPDVVKKAFLRYDAGAEIDAVQDPNAIYKLRSHLEKAGIYDHNDLERFKAIRGELIRAGRVADDIHEKLYSATQAAADRFNSRMQDVNEAITKWTGALRKAKQQGDEQGEIHAEHERKQKYKEREILTRFKSDLQRFGRQYVYVTQLVEFGDAELENYAGFVRLLAKRLDGAPPESVDVSSLTLTAYAIYQEKLIGAEDEGSEELDVRLHKTEGATPAEPDGEVVAHLSELVSMLNEMFGEMATPREQAAFANSMADKVQENASVTAQVRNNPQEQALQGDMPDVVKDAVYRVTQDQRARQSAFHELGERLLSKDTQTMDRFLGLMYRMVKEGERVEV